MCAQFVKNKHDLGLLRADGTTIGLRLAKDKNGTPIYRIVDDEYLAQQFFSGSPDYANLPPEKELSIRQDDWRTGFGQEVYDEPKRYFSSIGMDMRYKGMAVAGPVSTAVTPSVYTPPSIANADMELNSDWTNGAQSAAQKHGGASSWLSSAVQNVYQTPAWSASYQGKTFYFYGYMYTAQANQGRLFLYDGKTYTYSSYHTGGGTWEFLSVSKTFAADATEFTIGMNNNAGVAQYFDDVYLASKGVPTAFADFNDKLYVASGRSLFNLNGTGDGWTFLMTFPSTITDLETFTDNKLYICLGLSNNYWEMNTDEVFTENTTLAVKKFNYFCRVDAAAPVMWGSDSAYTIRSNTNPANGGAAWSGITTIDTSYYDITDLISTAGSLYIMKEDMPYYLSGATVQRDLAPELKSLTASTSGKNVFLWKNALYIPFGSQGLLETISSVNTFLNPASYCTNLSDFVGRVMAVSADEEWLFVAVDNDTKIEILAGREETIDGTTSWVWHPIHELTLAGCEKLYTSSVFQKRLWIASTSASDDLYYIPLPTGYGNITADANCSFKTNSYMITPWLHGNFRGDTKAFIKITALLGHSYVAGIYFECWYEKLEDTSWTDAGDLKGTATSRIATLYLPIDASSNKPKSTMIRFKFVAKTDDAQKTPILLGYDVRAILYPTNRRIIECEVLCSDDIVLKDGIMEKGQAATIKTALEEARNATWPVTFYPIDWLSSSDNIYVKFLPMQMAVTKDEKGRATEKHYLLRLQEVSLS